MHYLQEKILRMVQLRLTCLSCHYSPCPQFMAKSKMAMVPPWHSPDLPACGVFQRRHRAWNKDIDELLGIGKILGRY